MVTPASDGNTAARIYEFEIYGPGSVPGPGHALRRNQHEQLRVQQRQHGDLALGNGGVEVLGGDVRSRQAFGDFKLHIEFWLPNLPPDVTGQARANSGIYLQDRYELQVLDSFGDTTPANNECGAIYLNWLHRPTPPPLRRPGRPTT